MHKLRSVSGHVSPVRSLKPAPLRSRSITRVRRYYGRLRLPVPVLPSSLFRLVGQCAIPCARYGISWVTAPSLCQARHGLRSRGGMAHLPLTRAMLLPAGVLIPSAIPNAVISGLKTFTVGFTRYHCTSPALVPTHQADCYQPTCKAQFPARG